MSLNGMSVGVIGAGAIGSSLALLCSLGGGAVTLIGRSEASIVRCRGNVETDLALLASESLIEPDDAATARRNLSYAIGLDPDVIGKCDVVIEAIAEDLAEKQAVFRAIEPMADRDCLLASTTSGLPVDRIFADMADPGRALVTHFANPPLLMPAVELVPGSATSDATMNRARLLVEALGKDAVILRTDTPGHLFNRIQFAMLREAMALVSSGVATAEQVDKVVKNGLALRLPAEGPLEKIDLAGLELVESVATYLFPALDRSQAPDFLRQLIAEGRLGAASGAGIHDWPEGRRADAIERRARHLIAQLRLAGKAPGFGAPAGNPQANERRQSR